MLASYKNHLEVVKYLVERGADVGLQNKKGDTAYLLALKYKNRNIGSYLLNR
jgi:ankyrin repeat protein